MYGLYYLILIISCLTFFPSNSCVPCDRTLSTLLGSANVMNPNPLKQLNTVVLFRSSTKQYIITNIKTL